MAANNNPNYGISGPTALQITFITLKLCGIIDWSWWWVLSPTWIPLTITLFIVGIYWLILKFAKYKG